MELVRHPFFSVEKKEVEFIFERKKLTGYAHQTIAGALLMNGIYHLGNSKAGHPRGVFQYEPRSETCYVLINKKDRVLATNKMVEDGMVVDLFDPKPDIGSMNHE
jgi:hypothetical protein